MTCPHNSHLTAIHRRTLSAPMKYLKEQGIFSGKGSVLDYGCGRGFDAKELGIFGWDPHHANDPLLVDGFHQYDIITCNYVLNVLPKPKDRADIQDHIIDLLADKGAAYLTVRNDRLELNGETKRGTWQGEVAPDHRWELIRSTSTYRMYAHTKRKR